MYMMKQGRRQGDQTNIRMCLHAWNSTTTCIMMKPLSILLSHHMSFFLNLQNTILTNKQDPYSGVLYLLVSP